jgi:UDP-N-acetylglucosamine acyltransferase
MNSIHPTAIVDDRVVLGNNNVIGAYTVITGPTLIGNNNIISPHVVIGGPGQDTRNPRYDSNECRIEIGDNNIIREFTAIQKPCYKEVTKVGNNVFLMQSVHIPHDAILDDDVVITPMCVLAGLTHILNGANIGMGSSIHQYSVVGQYSLVGMGSALTKNIRPFTIFVQGKQSRPNLYAIEKFKFSDYTDEIIKYVKEGKSPTSDRIIEIVEKFEKLHMESKRSIYI